MAGPQGAPGMPGRDGRDGRDGLTVYGPKGDSGDKGKIKKEPMIADRYFMDKYWYTPLVLDTSIFYLLKHDIPR